MNDSMGSCSRRPFALHSLLQRQALIIVGASGVSAGVRAVPPLVVAVKPYVTKKSAKAVFCATLGLACKEGPPDELARDLEAVGERAANAQRSIVRDRKALNDPPKPRKSSESQKLPPPTSTENPKSELIERR